MIFNFSGIFCIFFLNSCKCQHHSYCKIEQTVLPFSAVKWATNSRPLSIIKKVHHGRLYKGFLETHYKNGAVCWDIKPSGTFWRIFISDVSESKQNGQVKKKPAEHMVSAIFFTIHRASLIFRHHLFLSVARTLPRMPEMLMTTSKPTETRIVLFCLSQPFLRSTVLRLLIFAFLRNFIAELDGMFQHPAATSIWISA